MIASVACILADAPIIDCIVSVDIASWTTHGMQSYTKGWQRACPDWKWTKKEIYCSWEQTWQSQQWQTLRFLQEKLENLLIFRMLLLRILWKVLKMKMLISCSHSQCNISCKRHFASLVTFLKTIHLHFNDKVEQWRESIPFHPNKVISDFASRGLSLSENAWVGAQNGKTHIETVRLKMSVR